MGYGDTASHDRPPGDGIDLGGNHTALSVAVGGAHACALLDNRGVKCWGQNNKGQLGYGDTTDRNAPPIDFVNLGRNRTARQVVAGADYTCAILDNNEVKCWGNILGDRRPNNARFLSAPLIVESIDFKSVYNVLRLAAGSIHTCAVLDGGRAKCWGVGDHGRLGYENVHFLPEPAADPIDFDNDITGVTEIAAGERHTCALFFDRSVKCWGAGEDGQLGYGNTRNLPMPLPSFTVYP